MARPSSKTRSRRCATPCECSSRRARSNQKSCRESFLWLVDLGERLDLHQQIGVCRLRHRDDSAVRRRRAEVTLAQIGVFIEFGGLFDVADRKDDVLDGCTSRFEACANILAHLLDLLLQIALADDIAGRVARDLPAHYDPVAAIT